MVQTLKSIHGGGGSVRVGTTGTIGTLMMRELDSLKHMRHSSTSSRKIPPTLPVSVPCHAIPRKSMPRRSLVDETSRSSSSIYRNPRNTQKMKSDLQKSDHHIPMLSSSDVPMEGKPNGEKLDKKGPSIVEVVDLKCGSLDRPWSSPITTRLKKLGFSKLSESVS
ncbi:hypothetical protein MRB53_030611 [Persea americana]|uniref:Uncharacterized protein n=1 Tax=Persea americana TaxID=3435 RepID=A0ACC2KMS9_PERAE|nr:hypothetical protein MRB53_030611 [Persea americana]